MDQAIEAAKESYDTTKVGCAIVGPDGALIATAHNHIPWGVRQTPSRESRPEKYKFFEHAERAAIYACVRDGVSTLGSHMYCTLFCCTDCARGIAMSGIQHMTVPEPDWDDERWGESWAAAKQILDETGVKVHWYRPPCVDEDQARAVLGSVKISAHKVALTDCDGRDVVLTKSLSEHEFDAPGSKMAVKAYLDSPWPHVMVRVAPKDGAPYAGAVNFMGEVCLPISVGLTSAPSET
jgi:dCMP deaminase